MCCTAWRGAAGGGSAGWGRLCAEPLRACVLPRRGRGSGSPLHAAPLQPPRPAGHVTFFWNGNRSGYFDEELETYVEVRAGLSCV